MKKILLVLFFLVFSFGLVGATYAQEPMAEPEVLAATTTKTPALLPKVLTGENLVVRETVNQDLITLGRNVEIRASVNGNLLVLGGEVTIEPEAHISGYVIAAGGQVDIQGKIDGEVRAAGGKVTVGDGGVLGGNVYVDAKEIAISDKAKVLGQKKLNIIRSDKGGATSFRQGLGALGFLAIVGFIGKIVLMLILVRLFGKHIAKITTQATKTFWSTLALGLAKLVLTPFLIILLLMTLIGFPVAMAVILVYGAALYLAEYIGAAILGHYIAVRGWIKTDNLYWQAVIGLVLLWVLSQIPVVGWLIKAMVFLLGLGIVVRAEKHLIHN